MENRRGISATTSSASMFQDLGTRLNPLNYDNIMNVGQYFESGIQKWRDSSFLLDINVVGRLFGGSGGMVKGISPRRKLHRQASLKCLWMKDSLIPTSDYYRSNSEGNENVDTLGSRVVCFHESESDPELCNAAEQQNDVKDIQTENSHKEDDHTLIRLEKLNSYAIEKLRSLNKNPSYTGFKGYAEDGPCKQNSCPREDNGESAESDAYTCTTLQVLEVESDSKYVQSRKIKDPLVNTNDESITETELIKDSSFKDATKYIICDEGEHYHNDSCTAEYPTAISSSHDTNTDHEVLGFIDNNKDRDFTEDVEILYPSKTDETSLTVEVDEDHNGINNMTDLTHAAFEKLNLIKEECTASRDDVDNIDPDNKDDTAALVTEEDDTCSTEKNLDNLQSVNKDDTTIHVTEEDEKFSKEAHTDNIQSANKDDTTVHVKEEDKKCSTEDNIVNLKTDNKDDTDEHAAEEGEKCSTVDKRDNLATANKDNDFIEEELENLCPVYLSVQDGFVYCRILTPTLEEEIRTKNVDDDSEFEFLAIDEGRVCFRSRSSMDKNDVSAFDDDDTFSIGQLFNEDSENTCEEERLYLDLSHTRGIYEAFPCEIPEQSEWIHNGSISTISVHTFDDNGYDMYDVGDTILEDASIDPEYFGLNDLFREPCEGQIDYTCEQDMDYLNISDLFQKAVVDE